MADGYFEPYSWQIKYATGTSASAWDERAVARNPVTGMWEYVAPKRKTKKQIEEERKRAEEEAAWAEEDQRED